MPTILALDQGTTSSRAIVFMDDGTILAAAHRALPQSFPADGGVEHDPREIWATQLSAIHEALAHASVQSGDIAAVGIANQRETTLIWDRETGEPIHPAIVWQDRRTASWCEQQRLEGYEPLVQSRTGLPIDPYFSAGKIAWLLDHVPGARQRAECGRLAFGTVDSWLVWHLTGGRTHVTDMSNASRTMLFNIHQKTWDAELLALWRIPPGLLPRVCASNDVGANVETIRELRGVPITAMMGDQQAALFGQRCVERGMLKTTYGTGCFLLQNTGEQAVVSKNRLLTTIAWKIGERLTYASEGSIFVGGAVVQWLQEGLGLSPSTDGVEALAASVPDNGGVYLVPAFVGLGAPHWDPRARGAILGLTRGTTAAHLARAAVESMAYQVADVVDALSAETAVAPRELRVDGGASRNRLLMQFQADLLGMPVRCSPLIEMTGLGAAYLAGLAAGVWSSFERLPPQAGPVLTFQPRMPRAEVVALRARWTEAVQRAKHWEK